jgi:hypothetical protein
LLVFGLQPGQFVEFGLLDSGGELIAQCDTNVGMLGEPRLEGALDVAIGEAGIAINRAAMGVFQEM